MMSYRYVLFDLDGTLTDSGPGIMNGFDYTIEKMGGTEEDRKDLRRFIGPPLEESFGKILGYSPENVEKAIKIYREYYFEKGGITENSVYPGIPDLLKSLKDLGLHLIVATSKAQRGADFVMDHYGLSGYFDLVSSANYTDKKTKTDVIRYAMEKSDIKDPKSAVMIGDRHYDITSAKEFGLDSIGVLYGYGSREEFESAGATYIAETPDDILKIISDNTR